jgi:hypothetical protein
MNPRQIRFIKNLRKLWKIKEYIKPLNKELGFTRLIKGTQEVFVNSNLIKSLQEITLIHEYGHIYYDHNLVDFKKWYDKIQESFRKFHPGKKDLGRTTLHRILNICMDLQVNSTLLDSSQLDLMKANGYQLMTPEYYQVPPMLKFYQYIDDVVKKLQFVQVTLGDGIGTSEIDPLLIPEIVDDMDKEGMEEGSNESQNSNSEDKEGNDYSSDAEEIEGDEYFGNDESEDPINGSESEAREDFSPEGHFKSFVMSPVTVAHRIDDILELIRSYKLDFQSDSLRLYNRNSRGNRNLMYTSLKNKLLLHKHKLAVIVDVSGSMGSKIPKIILNSLKKYQQSFHSDSIVVLWDTNLVEEYSITKLPKEFYLGGGTDMTSALHYVVSQKKFDKVLLISDFYDYLQRIDSFVKESHIDAFYISYGVKQEELKKSLPSFVNGKFIQNLG